MTPGTQLAQRSTSCGDTGGAWIDCVSVVQFWQAFCTRSLVLRSAAAVSSSWHESVRTMLVAVTCCTATSAVIRVLTTLMRVRMPDTSALLHCVSVCPIRRCCLHHHQMACRIPNGNCQCARQCGRVFVPSSSSGGSSSSSSGGGSNVSGRIMHQVLACAESTQPPSKKTETRQAVPGDNTPPDSLLVLQPPLPHCWPAGCLAFVLLSCFLLSHRCWRFKCSAHCCSVLQTANKLSAHTATCVATC